jgi:hypothetical protein
MDGHKDFLGEEESARQKRREHDRVSAGAGGLVSLLALIYQALFKEATTGAFAKFSAVIGSARAWIIALIIGAVAFCILKIYLFYKACCQEAIFDKWRCFKVTARHYTNISMVHPYLLLSVACYSSTLLFFFWVLSKQYKSSFPVYMFIATATTLNMLSILLYRKIIQFARISQGDLGQVLLKKTHPGIKWKKAGTANPNELINKKLLELKNVNLICIAAVHFSHLMKSVEYLKIIGENNPNAKIYYMPQFPYSWHILERAAELEYFYRGGYRDPLLHGIYNAREHLKAEVMLRHNPVEFRLTAWVKFVQSENNKQLQSKNQNVKEEIQFNKIDFGGFFVQQYIHGQEGYEGSYLNVDQNEWCGALIYMINWFFDDWKNNCSPIKFEEVLEERNYMLRVAEGIGLTQRKVNSLMDAGKLETYLQDNDALKELYLGIEKGEL